MGNYQINCSDEILTCFDDGYQAKKLQNLKTITPEEALKLQLFDDFDIKSLYQIQNDQAYFTFDNQNNEQNHDSQQYSQSINQDINFQGGCDSMDNKIRDFDNDQDSQKQKCKDRLFVANSFQNSKFIEMLKQLTEIDFSRPQEDLSRSVVQKSEKIIEKQTIEKELQSQIIRKKSQSMQFDQNLQADYFLNKSINHIKLSQAQQQASIEYLKISKINKKNNFNKNQKNKNQIRKIVQEDLERKIKQQLEIGNSEIIQQENENMKSTLKSTRQSVFQVQLDPSQNIFYNTNEGDGIWYNHQKILLFNDNQNKSSQIKTNNLHKQGYDPRVLTSQKNQHSKSRVKFNQIMDQSINSKESIIQTFGAPSLHKLKTQESKSDSSMHDESIDYNSPKYTINYIENNDIDLYSLQRADENIKKKRNIFIKSSDKISEKKTINESQNKNELDDQNNINDVQVQQNIRFKRKNISENIDFLNQFKDFESENVFNSDIKNDNKLESIFQSETLQNFLLSNDKLFKPNEQNKVFDQNLK